MGAGEKVRERRETMGTRADFYVGKGTEAEWLGSIAWDGHPDAEAAVEVGSATTEAEFRQAVTDMLAQRDDATLPERGWPWPWNDSQTTDYAYSFDDGRVTYSCFGTAWKGMDEEDNEIGGGKVAIFPDMTERKNVTWGKRSGVIVIGARGIVDEA